MFISARILRRDAERVDPDPPLLTAKQEAQRNRILVIGRSLMARHGRHAISLSAFAIALGIGTGTIRRYFPDLDALHVAIIEEHLATIREALRNVPRDLPDRPAALRAAYFQASRDGPGRLSEGHLLLTRDRHLLPEDEQEPLDRALIGLGSLLGADALLLLDKPEFSLREIEAMLRSMRPAQPDVARREGTASSPPASPPCTGLPRNASHHETGPPPGTRHNLRRGSERHA